MQSSIILPFQPSYFLHSMNKEEMFVLLSLTLNLNVEKDYYLIILLCANRKYLGAHFSLMWLENLLWLEIRSRN